ncbi:MAG TPA: hypothetical protein VFR20_03255 [Burkholderiaceae bacterium]|nr:hypothetical protein [Burkholderiaceae bacterium]
MPLINPNPRASRLAWIPAHILIGVLLAVASQGASAQSNDARECRAAGGTLLVGQVVSAPKFKRGRRKMGVELSHTHLKLQGNDGTTYDVAIDNVFASGYRPHSRKVPEPLNTIVVGDKVEACGIPFRGGIHWVHNNCGDRPTRRDPNGWLKVVRADGSTGPNLEGSQKYCGLWPRR